MAKGKGVKRKSTSNKKKVSTKFFVDTDEKTLDGLQILAKNNVPIWMLLNDTVYSLSKSAGGVTTKKIDKSVKDFELLQDQDEYKIITPPESANLKMVKDKQNKTKFFKININFDLDSKKMKPDLNDEVSNLISEKKKKDKEEVTIDTEYEEPRIDSDKGEEEAPYIQTLAEQKKNKESLYKEVNKKPTTIVNETDKEGETTVDSNNMEEEDTKQTEKEKIKDNTDTQIETYNKTVEGAIDKEVVSTIHTNTEEQMELVKKDETSDQIGDVIMNEDNHNTDANGENKILLSNHNTFNNKDNINPEDITTAIVSANATELVGGALNEDGTYMTKKEKDEEMERIEDNKSPISDEEHQEQYTKKILTELGDELKTVVDTTNPAVDIQTKINIIDKTITNLDTSTGVNTKIITNDIRTKMLLPLQKKLKEANDDLKKNTSKKEQQQYEQEKLAETNKLKEFEEKIDNEIQMDMVQLEHNDNTMEDMLEGVIQSLHNYKDEAGKIENNGGIGPQKATIYIEDKIKDYEKKLEDHKEAEEKRKENENKSEEQRQEQEHKDKIKEKENNLKEFKQLVDNEISWAFRDSDKIKAGSDEMIDRYKESLTLIESLKQKALKETGFGENKFMTYVTDKMKMLNSELNESIKKKEENRLNELKTGENMESVTDILNIAKEKGILKDSTLNESQQKKNIFQLIVQNKTLDIFTVHKDISFSFADANIDATNMKNRQMSDLVSKYVEGDEENLDLNEDDRRDIGTPIFTPHDTFDELYEMQQSLVITNAQAKKVRNEMKPLWDTFKTIQMTDAMYKNSAIADAFFTTDKSTIRDKKKLAAELDKDRSQFMEFLYYVLHFGSTTNESTENERSVRQLLYYPASLGYTDVSKAEWNYLLTGNKNADLGDHIDYSKLHDSEYTEEELKRKIIISKGVSISLKKLMILNTTLKAPIQDPIEEFPSRNVSPSAATDQSRHPDNSTYQERINKVDSSRPSWVLNIPDPATSKRGGKNIDNTREITIPNRDYDPKAKEGDKDYDKKKDKFIQATIPDIAVGSKDIANEIEKAESDRLLEGQNFKLYAPIHANAVDRYLGKRNFMRLSLPDEEYLQKYADQQWNVSNIKEMYHWNVFVLQLYGPMLYSHVTDINLIRTQPVFDISLPGAVILEFKELNELMKELKRYQEHSTDRADRIGDGGVGNSRPMEKALDDYFKQRQTEDSEEGKNTVPQDAIVIKPIIPPYNPKSASNDYYTFENSDEEKDSQNEEEEESEEEDNQIQQPQHKKFRMDKFTLNYGIRKSNVESLRSLPKKRKVVKENNDINHKKHKMFHSFSSAGRR
jgi:hypothetical protein